MSQEQEIKTRIEEIKKLAEEGDDEKAHILEDRLLVFILTACASGAWSKQDMIEMCELALESQKIDFSRWCA